AETTSQKRSWRLLTLLPKRGPRAFSTFCMALKETEQEHLSSLLIRFRENSPTKSESEISFTQDSSPAMKRKDQEADMCAFPYPLAVTGLRKPSRPWEQWGLVPQDALEGSESRGRVSEGVLGILGSREELTPVLLLTAAVGAEVPADFLIQPLCLTVGLRVVPGTEAYIKSEVSAEAPPNPRGELGPRPGTMSSGRPYLCKMWWNRVVTVSIAVSRALRGTSRHALENLSMATKIVVYPAELGMSIIKSGAIWDQGRLGMRFVDPKLPLPTEECAVPAKRARTQESMEMCLDADSPLTTAVLPCTQEFYLSHCAQAYSMSSSPRGLALVLSNVHFEPELSELDTRRGGEVDEEVLRRLFTELDFKVSLQKDLTVQAMRACIEQFAQQPEHAVSDCCVVCLLSHGVEGSIYGVDGKLLELDWVFERFDNGRCPLLQNKPKMFFIQACRGEEMDCGVDQLDGDDAMQPTDCEQRDAGREENHDRQNRASEMSESERLRVKLPQRSDMICGFATLKGFSVHCCNEEHKERLMVHSGLQHSYETESQRHTLIRYTGA
ncbi:hypothetical protein QTP86_022318, partial [Hemibagrus guttatus]